MSSPVKFQRKNALTMEDVISQYIREMKLAAGLNTQLIFSAWDSVSGAGPYTLDRFFRDGRLYITLKSSVVRNQLSFQKDALIQKMNEMLSADPLFILDAPHTSLVKELILK